MIGDGWSRVLAPTPRPCDLAANAEAGGRWKANLLQSPQRMRIPSIIGRVLALRDQRRRQRDDVAGGADQQALVASSRGRSREARLPARRRSAPARCRPTRPMLRMSMTLGRPLQRMHAVLEGPRQSRRRASAGPSSRSRCPAWPAPRRRPAGAPSRCSRGRTRSRCSGPVMKVSWICCFANTAPIGTARVGHALGDRHQVGRRRRSGRRAKARARAAEAGDDLVEDQQDAVLVADARAGAAR